jgi:endonuclease YncB( thermonuclease family)
MRQTVLLAMAALSLATPRAAAEIAGKPRIVDGNTLALGTQFVRLSGIAAPEEPAMCDAGGRRWPCGQDASFALARIVETHWIFCAERGTDTRGRVLAVCRMGGPDGPEVNAAMVRQGWARAEGGDYAAAEDAARRERVGLWGEGR